MVAAKGDGREHIFFVARNYDSDGNLAVVRAVGGIDGAAALVEANFSAQMAAEGGFKGGGIELHRMWSRWGSGLGHKAQNIFVDEGLERKRRK